MKIAGYEIVRKEAYKPSETYDRGILMGIHPSKNCPARYATWEYTLSHANESMSGEEELSAYWGHYFDSEVEAYKDYYTRLAKAYDRPWDGV